MSHSISRRAVLGAAAAVPVTAALPMQFAEAATKATFTLNAVVLDGGEQIVSVTLHTAGLGNIDPASLKLDTFKVHAKATSPIPIDPGDLIFNEHDTDREVTKATIDQRGNITLELFTLDRTTPGSLGYILLKGTNVELDLVYTITQLKPLKLRNRRNLVISAFKQGKKSNPEVDAFTYGESKGGMKYRLFTPANNGHNVGGKQPLVVWLHGGGEGGMGGAYYTNETTLRANRGALGFATGWGQRIFGNAFVVAPQAITAWMSDGDGFAPQIKALIDELLASNHKIDPKRVHVIGCSNGGYMSLKMTSIYTDFFATSTPICPGASEVFFTDDQLAKCSSTPTWFVHSKDDTTLPWEENTGRAMDIMDGEIATLYDNVTWNGIPYPGHWSWIYVGHNDPTYKGKSLYQWMAKTKR